MALALLLTLTLQACGGGGDGTAAAAPVEVPAADPCASQATQRAAALATNPAGTIDDPSILQYAFDAPAVPGWLRYPAISRVVEVQAMNAGIFTLADGFENAYDCIRIDGVGGETAPGGSQQAVRVDFSYRGTAYAAWAYGSKPAACDGQAAALVIPGSGDNEGTAIIERRANDYHAGMLDALEAVDSTYVLIKPNEDLLAWHDGQGRKLGGNLVYTYHLNRGGSYSVSYLVQSLAFTKWMKSCFRQTVVAGLSQGGAAVLMNAVQSSPTAAVVAAGHSLLYDQFEYAGINQLLGVPGYAALAKRDTLRSTLGSSSTQWLFTWGRADTDIYKFEADTGYTASVIEPLANVDVAIHDGGHEVPVAQTQAFLKAALTD